MPNALSGKALTVLGAVEAEAMGVTLPHEHLLIDFEVMFREPAAASDKGLAYQPVSLANVGWVRQNFNANLDNLRLLDEQTAAGRDHAVQARGRADRGRSHQREPRARSAGAGAHRARHRPQHRHGRRLLRGRLASARHGPAQRGLARATRSSPTSRSASATPACGPGSSGRSATPGRGRRTRRRSCGRPSRPSARRARR